MRPGFIGSGLRDSGPTNRPRRIPQLRFRFITGASRPASLVPGVDTASKNMPVSGKLWMRCVGLGTLLLCLLLAVVPLYYVGVPEGIGPHWSTVFDLPSDWYLLPSGMLGGRWLPYASILGLRCAMLLLTGITIALCVFKRFRFRWLPLLILGVLSTGLAFYGFYPRLGDGTVRPLGFGLLVAACVSTFWLVLLHFAGTRGSPPEA